jgi:hypothetical protein
VIRTSVLHICGELIGEVANIQALIWTGWRLTGGVVSAPGLAFLLQTLAESGRSLSA